MEPYRKAAFTFSKTLQYIKNTMDSDNAWDNYPPDMSRFCRKNLLEEAQPSWSQAGYSGTLGNDDFNQSNGSDNGVCGNDGYGGYGNYGNGNCRGGGWNSSS